ncbi:hypothetical protein FGG08_003816 [Glutinoglossum americanum]|uniref:SprT-like domain-containing protein n=1 Tax=Glutinoglossum americanum TaxID=1670608 RepID=A0A9P8I6W8_9PEZI|nr:hypothetical protein FGG08_003816 [Glutinoglossum americanum]
MHAEILSAVFPPQYPNGQLMHHKGPHNPQTGQLNPQSHNIHKGFCSYQPTFGNGHLDGSQPKASVLIQHAEEPTVTANFIATVHQPPTFYDYHRLPKHSNPPTHGQPPFGAGHVDANRLQVPMPAVVPENEVTMLQHGGAEPYEHPGTYPSNHYHQHSDREKLPVETNTIRFDQNQQLNRSRSHSPPMQVAVLEDEVIVVLDPSGIDAHNYPSDHQQQFSDCEKIRAEINALSFGQGQHYNRSRSHTPTQVMLSECDVIVVLDPSGIDAHNNSESYPSDYHQQQPSDCGMNSTKSATASFNQHQQPNYSRSPTPTQTAKSNTCQEQREAIPSQEESGFSKQNAEFIPRGRQCLITAQTPPRQPSVSVDHQPTPTLKECQPQTPSIESEPVFYPPPTPGFRVITEPQPEFYLLEHEPMTDEQAATSVYNYFSERNNSSKQAHAEQELSRLILSSPFMTGCLGEVVHWANILFFEEKLTVAKVDLQWSDPLDLRFEPSSGGLIGTTELKPDHTGGFQTRIILSRQRLMSGTYDQRLVLSAILHECIHAYLFICRGFAATEEGGHTRGFREIARLIDCWVDGDGSFLRLGCQEADLESFRTRTGHGWDCGEGSWGLDNGFLWTSSRL